MASLESRRSAFGRTCGIRAQSFWGWVWGRNDNLSNGVLASFRHADSAHIFTLTSSMTTRFGACLTAALLLLLSACNKASLPTGINYVLDASPKVTINLQGNAGRLLVGDEYSPSKAEISVAQVAPPLELPLLVTVKNGEQYHLPPTFTLVPNEGLPRVKCSGCVLGYDSWSRVASP